MDAASPNRIAYVSKLLLLDSNCRQLSYPSCFLTYFMGFLACLSNENLRDATSEIIASLVSQMHTLSQWHFMNIYELSMQSEGNNSLTKGRLNFLTNLANLLFLRMNPYATLSMLENVLSAINNLIGLFLFEFSLYAKLIAHTPPIEYP